MAAAGAPAPRRASALDPSSWLAVGVLGLLLFGSVVASIFVPILARFPYPNEIPFALAIAGGVLTVLGFTRYSQLREVRKKGPRPLPEAMREAGGVAELPSFQVYDPKDRRR
jgi:hypothetical protein